MIDDKEVGLRCRSMKPSLAGEIVKSSFSLKTSSQILPIEWSLRDLFHQELDVYQLLAVNLKYPET